MFMCAYLRLHECICLRSGSISFSSSRMQNQKKKNFDF